MKMKIPPSAYHGQTASPTGKGRLFVMIPFNGTECLWNVATVIETIQEAAVPSASVTLIFAFAPSGLMAKMMFDLRGWLDSVVVLERQGEMRDGYAYMNYWDGSDTETIENAFKGYATHLKKEKRLTPELRYIFWNTYHHESPVSKRQLGVFDWGNRMRIVPTGAWFYDDGA